MAKRSGSGEAKVDFSSFMPILILTIGCLVVLLVINTLIIVSNPKNVRITSVVRSSLYVEGGSGMEGGAPFPFGNKKKEPTYVDVHKDRLVVYPGAQIVPVRDLNVPGNAFEKLLSDVVQRKEELYIVLLIRPRAASIARRVQKAILDRGIDVGHELFESERPVEYQDVNKKVSG